MQKTHFSLALMVSFLAGTLLVAFNADAVWSISVDLAHHYALAFRIAENWQLVPNDPTLGEMNVYPRLTHTLAAILGTLFGSVFVGVQVVALASLALLWAACLAVLYTLPRHAATLAAIVLALLVWLNYQYVGFDLHGAEIVGNFFFSQLFAQALSILAIAVAIHLDGHKSRAFVYGFLLLADYVVMRAHLLGALELLGVLVGLVVLDNLTLKGDRRKRLGFAALSLAVLGVAMLIVVRSPGFEAMRQISENNGRLILQHLDSQSSLIVLAVVGLGVAAALLLGWLRGGRRMPALKFMALYGGAVSALCLLQSSLLRFGLGSEYAVKKYAFGITSFIVLAVALLAGIWLTRLLKMRGSAAPAVPAPLSALVVVVALWIAFTYCARPVKMADASDIVKLEHQLLALRDTSLQAPVPGKTDLVIDLGGQSGVINYMFSIAVLHAPRAVAGTDLLLDYKLGPIDQYRTIISSRATSRYSGRNCAPTSTGALLAIDASCLKQAVIAASMCQQTLDFSIKGDMEVAMLSGFSVPEQEGRWTDGPRATVTCTVQKPFRLAHLSVSPFLAGGHPRQRVAFSVNGGAPVHEELTAKSGGASITLPLPTMTPGQPLVFTIDIPDAVSPKQLGVGDDGRRLGVTVQHITFE